MVFLDLFLSSAQRDFKKACMEQLNLLSTGYEDTVAVLREWVESVLSDDDDLAWRKEVMGHMIQRSQEHSDVLGVITACQEAAVVYLATRPAEIETGQRRWHWARIPYLVTIVVHLAAIGALNVLELDFPWIHLVRTLTAVLVIFSELHLRTKRDSFRIIFSLLLLVLAFVGWLIP